MKTNSRFLALLVGAVAIGTAALLPLGAAALLPAVAEAGPAANCDRACLDGIVEQYLAALPTHDPARAPLAPEVRYTEDGIELSLPDGLWRTASAVGKYRLVVADPEQGEVGFFAKMRENGAPVLLATRLRVVDRKITQIESVVARSSDFFGAASGSHPHDVLGDAPRPQFRQVLPPADRRSRQQMIDIVNTYFTGIENNTGARPPLFASDCNRIENGAYTTNRPLRAGGQPSSLNYSCKEAFALGYYHNDTRIRDRRYLVIDRERGLVYASVEFDHDATIRSYRLKNGRTVVVKRTAPWTWMANEIFQINREGRISQVEAVLLSVPYGMRPGWHTGVHIASPQAVRDHFTE
ncbi:MAG: hypothetical protein ACREU3_03505 [Steroidobacteraceae bacterium]